MGLSLLVFSLVFAGICFELRVGLACVLFICVFMRTFDVIVSRGGCSGGAQKGLSGSNLFFRVLLPFTDRLEAGETRSKLALSNRMLLYTSEIVN